MSTTFVYRSRVIQGGRRKSFGVNVERTEKPFDVRYICIIRGEYMVTQRQCVATCGHCCLKTRLVEVKTLTCRCTYAHADVRVKNGFILERARPKGDRLSYELTYCYGSSLAAQQLPAAPLTMEAV